MSDLAQAFAGMLAFLGLAYLYVRLIAIAIGPFWL